MQGQTAPFNRRAFLAAGGGAMGAAAFASAAWTQTSAHAASAGRRLPNIVIVLTDDLGYGTLGSYGQEQIKTPVLDKLAAEGVRYTDFYAGAAVCAPSRCTLLTGMHTGHATVRQNPTTTVDDPFRPDEVTFGHLLQSRGYTTALFGKWGFSPDVGEHFSHPNLQGFDEFYGYLTHIHAHQYYPSYLWHNHTRVEIPENKNNAQGVYAPDLMLERTLDFIDTNKDHPFLALVSTNIPHAPQHVPDYGPYANEPWGEGEKAHAAQITRMDGHVGRIVAKLEEHGIADDTVLIFLSDNGPHEEASHGGIPLNPDFFDDNGPLRGYKRNLHEGGIRTPAIIWAPGYMGHTAGTEVSQPLAFWDILPTLADLADAPVPPFVDGGSIRHTFDAAAQPTDRDHRPPLADRPLYWWRLEPHSTSRANAAEGGSVTRAAEAVRRGDWKAIRFAPGQDRTVPDSQWDLRLYNLATDIGEDRNVAAENASLAAAMLALMKQEWTEPSVPREKWSVNGLVVDAPAYLPPGQAAQVTVRLDNHDDKPYTRIEVQLQAPAGWTVRAPRRSRAAVRPGGSREFVFLVSVPSNASGSHQLTATAKYLLDHREVVTATATAGVVAVVPPLEDSERVPTTGWTFTASSSTDLSGNGRGGRPQHAFDGNTDTFWHSQWTPTQVPPPHWIQAQAPVAATVAEVQFLLRSDLERPRTLDVKVSDDGSNWTTVATRGYANGTSAGPTWNTVTFPSVRAAYVRLETNGTYEASNGHFVVREIEFWR
ncbi:hypothetical protein GCM10025789_25090 [Tessaracoccus lubricantis]|uniref:F5/8 type C domain-containing protein n=1 Tax=Tessaracoccus lubricantis TaxID=545543 RepID=A0ABP9FJ11_9ACTN